MTDTAWTDPRYTELVATFDRLRQERATTRQTVRPCPSCLHGLGAIMMVDLTTRQPILAPCTVCAPLR